MSNQIHSDIKSNKELLTLFKKSYIDSNVFVGQLYSLSMPCGFNKFNVNNTASNTKVTLNTGEIIMITKIRIVESIDYFNMGPALIISILHKTSNYHLFIFPNQISKKMSSAASLKYSTPSNLLVNFNNLFKKI